MSIERRDEEKSRTEAVVIPATEVAHTHDPQPKEELKKEAAAIPDGQMESSQVDTGDEITDGEDA